MVDIKSVVTHTLQNGGGTFPMPSGGYMVGGVVPSAICKTQDMEDFLARFLVEHEDAVESAYLGTWIEGDTVYIDVAENVPDLETAVRLGRQRGEKAIYDVANGRSIYVDEGE